MPSLTIGRDLPEAQCVIDAEFAATAPFNGTVDRAISFAADERYLQRALDNPHVVAVIVPEALADRGREMAEAAGKGLCLHATPRDLFFRLHNRLVEAWLAALPGPRIAAGARVADSARVHPGAVIGERVEIADLAVIGPGVELAAGAYVGEGALVGVVGHFEHASAGARFRVQHGGRLYVGENTQILPGAIVQRDVYANETRIERNVSIGPGVKLGHGVMVGEGTTVTGGTTVAGFTRIGQRVFIGPNATIGNNLTLGDGCRCEIGAVVIKDVSAGGRVSGNFAGRHTETVRDWARRQ